MKPVLFLVASLPFLAQNSLDLAGVWIGAAPLPAAMQSAMNVTELKSVIKITKSGSEWTAHVYSPDLSSEPSPPMRVLLEGLTVRIKSPEGGFEGALSPDGATMTGKLGSPGGMSMLITYKHTDTTIEAELANAKETPLKRLMRIADPVAAPKQYASAATRPASVEPVGIKPVLPERFTLRAIPGAKSAESMRLATTDGKELGAITVHKFQWGDEMPIPIFDMRLNAPNGKTAWILGKGEFAGSRANFEITLRDATSFEELGSIAEYYRLGPLAVQYGFRPKRDSIDADVGSTERLSFSRTPGLVLEVKQPGRMASELAAIREPKLTNVILGTATLSTEAPEREQVWQVRAFPTGDSLYRREVLAMLIALRAWRDTDQSYQARFTELKRIEHTQNVAGWAKLIAQELSRLFF
ncbi:MAG: hypothetical protein IT168_24780 [Bryobacterales bacterium]|nr:hypothetical protein [Bryobacterales bacterium]